jgi:teichuronic acid biosynthesis glycosyltransferase TuaG
MPYYKKKAFIGSSIKSILNQTYQNFQIIVVDDELSDESFEVLKKISNLDSRIKIIKNQVNSGAGESRNNPMHISEGEYIAFCDCDDLWKETKLDNQIEFMKNLNIQFSYTAYEIIDENEIRIGLREAKEKLNFNDLVKSCDIGLSTVMFKKELLKSNNYKFANLKTKEDYILWLKFSNDGIPLNGLNKNLASWRKSKNSLSSSVLQKIKDGYRVYRYHLKYNTFKSIICLLVLSLNSVLR